MSKPPSMSMKDWLVSSTANREGIDEAICERVINWAYLKAKEATLVNSSVEFSGFGKIYASTAKTSRKIRKAESRRQSLIENGPSMPDEKTVAAWKKSLEDTETYLNYLRSKNQ
jgi:hypothetical protein